MPASKPIYAKTLNARTLLEFYTGVFAANLRLDDFKNLASQHFLKLLKGRTGSESSAHDTVLGVAADQATINLQQGDQQYLLSLIQADLIPAADLQAEMEREIGSSEELLLGDLALAYSKVRDPKFGEVAVRWLQGKALSDQEMRDLGARSRITTIPDAHHAFKFLLDAYRHAAVPMMLCIDELERSVLTERREPDATGRDLVKDIAEMMVVAGHLLVISGSREAWESLTPDFFGRVSQTDVCDMTLTDSEAADLIHSWEGPQPSEFSAAGLSMLVEVTERNPRRLLEVAHHSWELGSASPASQISPECVKEATRRVLGDSTRREDALATIARIAETSGIAASQTPRFPEYDRILGTVDSPLAFVKVTASVFKDDEIDHIRPLVEARGRVLQAYPKARTCTVIAGYSSPPILEALRRSGDRVFRFEEPQFSASFQNFVVAIQDRESESNRTTSSADEDRKYAELLKNFEQLAAGNKAQVDELRQSLAAGQQEKQEQLERRFAESSGDKLTGVLEEITSLLGQENDWISKGPYGAAPEFQRVYDRQRSLVQYAQFLDRVMPDSRLGQYLDRYRQAVDTAADAAASLPRDSSSPAYGWDPLRASYAERLTVLRDMRRATRSETPVVRALRTLASPRSLVGIFGAVCLVAYAAVLVTSFAADRRVVSTYAQELAALRALSIHYRYSSPTAIPVIEVTKRLTSVTEARSDVRATPFAWVVRSGDEFDRLLSDFASAIACAQQAPASASSTPSRCEGVVYSPRTIASTAEMELEETRQASFGRFLWTYVPQTLWWLLPGILALLVFGQWQRIRRWLGRSP